MKKTLVVFDSLYGNTEQIARAIGGALVDSGDVSVVRIGDAKLEQLQGVELLIVGSPTQGFRPTKQVQTFLGKIPRDELKGVAVAAFDTRIPADKVKGALRLLLKVGGYAAPHVAKALERKGGKQVVPPEGFCVQDREGPLAEGELERAALWAKEAIR